MKNLRRADSSKTLQSTIAGSWYPGTAQDLDVLLDKCFETVPEVDSDETPNVLLLPHAGYVYSAQTAAYAVKRILKSDFSRIILLAPSHRAYIGESFVIPESDAVSTPYGSISIDLEAVEKIASSFSVIKNNGIHANEHSAQIQYPILQYALEDFKIVPLIVGQLSNKSIKKAAEALKLIMDDDTLLVISTDFTHYGTDFGYAPFANNIRENVKQIDLEAFEKISLKDLEGFTKHLADTGATICGETPISIMIAMLPESANIEMTRYETSSDDTGDYSRFVCYMSAAGYADWSDTPGTQETSEEVLTSSEKKSLLKFARESIKYALENQQRMPEDFFKKEASGGMLCKMGCFVTLKMKNSGDLRGCIGEIFPRRQLFKAVTELAAYSAFEDYRFTELKQGEFDAVEIEISALTPPQAVNSWKDIEIGKHGMTLEKHGRSAVFLPQVAPEQNWTLEETLLNLSLKAGLKPDDWREGARFTVFEAIVFGES
jgi:AmmeMemoRadiSam system protein B/AmmeMemoRadiSam system protein A